MGWRAIVRRGLTNIRKVNRYQFWIYVYAIISFNPKLIDSYYGGTYENSAITTNALLKIRSILLLLIINVVFCVGMLCQGLNMQFNWPRGVLPCTWVKHGFIVIVLFHVCLELYRAGSEI